MIILNKATNFALELMLIATLIFSSCSTDTPEIKIEIPAEFKDNAEVVAYIEAMTITTNKFTVLSNDIAKITEGKNIDESDELSTMQTLKLAKVSMQMMQISSKMDQYKIQRANIDSTLSANQILLLDSVCNILEKQMGLIDPSNITIDKDEILAQEAKRAEQDTEVERQRAVWEQAQMELPEDERYDDVESSNPNEIKNVPKIFDVLFPLLVLSLIVFFAIMKIKKIRGKVRDFGHSIGDIKTKVHEIKTMTDGDAPEGKEMTAEQKKGLDTLDSFLNKKS
jgi:Sec-independent protein translocase protein TatA